MVAEWVAQAPGSQPSTAGARSAHTRSGRIHLRQYAMQLPLGINTLLPAQHTDIRQLQLYVRMPPDSAIRSWQVPSAMWHHSNGSHYALLLSRDKHDSCE